MRVRNPLIAAIVFALASTAPAAVAAVDAGSAGLHDREKDKDKDKRRNRDRRGDDRRGDDRRGRRGGEDLTRMRFAGMDTNRDGRITRDEWRGNDNSFDQHDWNGDGILSGPEVTPGAHPPGGRHGDDEADRFDRLDLNGDGRLSLNEWPGTRSAFERLDLDGDGFLTRDELRPRYDDRLERLFRDLDLNGDGVVSRAEWRGNLAHFDRLDRNGDGLLTREEFFGR